MSVAGSVTAPTASLVLEEATEQARDGPDESAPAEGAARGRAALCSTPAEAARLKAMMTTHFNFIWRSLQRLGVQPADVDDCAQQVFLVASRRLSVIAEGSEQSFLFGTALHVAAEARRSHARRRDTPMEDSSIEAFDPGPQPDEIADRKRARALLDKVLDAMPMDLRVVFVLFELEEMPLQNIASLLSIPTGTVASRLRRARFEFEKLVARLHKAGAPRGVKR